MPLKFATLLALLCCFGLSACSTSGTSTSGANDATAGNAGSAPIRVLTTFSTLNSFVEAVGGKRVTVQNLVPVGASPEEYQPTPQDIALISNAQLLVENGAGIEAWLDRTLRNAQNPGLRTIICSDGLPIKIGNPHLWMNPEYAKVYVRKIRDALVYIDPRSKKLYNTNARIYTQRLDALAHSIQRQVNTIPPQRRNMIVFHNAWLYYNERFGIRTIGVIEINPGQDPNPQQIAQLVDLSKKYHVQAIFSEPEYSPKLAQALAQSAGITIVADLYDDSIGQDPKVHDYISMLQYDTGVIVKSLK